MQASIFRERRFWLSSLFIVFILILAFPAMAQDGENYCRTEITQTIDVGETLTGSITSQLPLAFFCFEGERGDSVTVTVEVTNGQLIPALLITDKIFSQEDMENPLGYAEANREGGGTEVTFEIDTSDTYLIIVTNINNTVGTFEVTLETEGRSIFDTATEEPEENTEEPENNGEEEENGGSTGEPQEVIPGETNLCRIDGIEYIEYGGSVTGELDQEFQAYWYCFEAAAGDIVNIEVGTASGDIVMLALISTPFFDLTSETVLGGDEASSRNDSAEFEFEVPEDGDYLIFIQISDGEAGEYFIELEGTAGVSFDCSSEPLSLLAGQQWMIAPAEGEEAVVNVSVACDGQIAISVMGAPEVGFYDIDQEGNVSLFFGSSAFTTVSLDETAWTISNQAGTEYSLVPVPDTTCSEEENFNLINATWQLGNNDPALLSFMCNGILILNYQGEGFAQAYTYADGTITIDAGQGQVLEFEEVVIDGTEMTATLDGNSIELENILAD